MSADCVIIELSPHGARVRISSAVRLPPSVALLLISDGLLFDAMVAWRQGDATGLAFKGRHDLRTEDDPAYRSVRALWVELGVRSSEL